MTTRVFSALRQRHFFAWFDKRPAARNDFHLDIDGEIFLAQNPKGTEAQGKKLFGVCAFLTTKENRGGDRRSLPACQKTENSQPNASPCRANKELLFCRKKSKNS
jgi:hypothetical protein